MRIRFVLGVFRSKADVSLWGRRDMQDGLNDGPTGLFTFTRKLITQASTDAIYGPSKNPFHEPAVESGFW